MKRIAREESGLRRMGMCGVRIVRQMCGACFSKRPDSAFESRGSTVTEEADCKSAGRLGSLPYKGVVASNEQEACKVGGRL
jgi:hypothetical protein